MPKGDPDKARTIQHKTCTLLLCVTQLKLGRGPAEDQQAEEQAEDQATTPKRRGLLDPIYTYPKPLNSYINP